MKQVSPIIILSFLSLEQEVIKNNRSGIFMLSPNNMGNVSVQCERGENGKGKTCCKYE